MLQKLGEKLTIDCHFNLLITYLLDLTDVLQKLGEKLTIDCHFNLLITYLLDLTDVLQKLGEKLTPEETEVDRFL